MTIICAFMGTVKVVCWHLNKHISFYALTQSSASTTVGTAEQD